MKICRYILPLMLLLPTISIAQTIEVSAKTDSANYLIGDHINITMTITAPREYEVFFPALSDSLDEKIEVIRQGNIDSLNSSKQLRTLNKIFTIAIFYPGKYTFPPMPFWVKKAGDTGVTQILTNEVNVNVNAPEVDMQADIKDIRDIWKFPVTWQEIAPYAMWGLPILLLLAIGIWLYIKWKRKEPLFLFKPKPVVPPHIEAMSRLKKLHESQLWQNNQVKEYYTELSDILRCYIERAMNIPAVEMTSMELMKAFGKAKKIHNAEEQTEANTSRDKRLRYIIEEVLPIADLVKFAKSQPFVDEHDKCFKLVKEFVELTKPEEEVK